MNETEITINDIRTDLSFDLRNYGILKIKDQDFSFEGQYLSIRAVEETRDSKKRKLYIEQFSNKPAHSYFRYQIVLQAPVGSLIPGLGFTYHHLNGTARFIIGTDDSRVRAPGKSNLDMEIDNGVIFKYQVKDNKETLYIFSFLER